MENIKRVVAVHDISCFGKCSLTVAIPVISALGAEVCPIPTAVLSAYTLYKDVVMVDFTKHMIPITDHFEKLGFYTDVLYSGFLGSPEQIGSVEEAIKKLHPKVTVIDPVMGDNGRLYSIYDSQMCEAMQKLVCNADIATPNYTEACLLAGEAYTENFASEKIQHIAGKINDLGAKTVIITGIERNGDLYNCILDSNGYREHKNKLLPFRKSGTGDLFTSVLVGKLTQGKTTDDAVIFASDFVRMVLDEQNKYTGLAEGSVYFEPYLKYLFP